MNYMKNNALAHSLSKVSKEKKSSLVQELEKKQAKLDKEKLKNKKIEDEIQKLKALFETEAKDTLAAAIEAKEALLLNLVEKSKKKSLLQWQRQVLSDLITEEITTLYKLDLVSEPLRLAMAEYQDQLYKNMNKHEQAMADEMLDQLKEEYGLPEDFTMDKMQDPQFMEEFMRQRHHERFHAQQETLQKERLNGQKNADVDYKNLYRKLTRFAHPDLAKTEEEKAIKEEQIKQINSAWQALDYYQLIDIWMAIDPNNSLEVDFTEEHCLQIMQMLDEKIDEAKMDRKAIEQSSDYQFYYDCFYAKKKQDVLHRMARFCEMLAKETQQSRERNNKSKTLAKLKDLLAEIEHAHFIDDLGFDFDDDDDDGGFDLSEVTPEMMAAILEQLQGRANKKS
jgi:hypothetical protein